ncbi:MAG: hypothetical protein M3Q92_04570 [Actinomycetota bacterium]|nr:hypothetical protein [Actinomycetota bacterium]
MSPTTNPAFDPIGIFKALDRARAEYVVIGGLARVLQGTDELTDGVDVVPAMREQNLRRLDVAFGELNARRRDGKKNLALADVDVLDLETDLGELKIVPEPAGTRGYDDLRRAASREHLGSGVRVAIASVGDLARMTAALGREPDEPALRMLHRIAEIDRSRSHGLEL